MGFGAGALIGSIAYDLLPESLLLDARWGILAAFAAGALTFFAGDWLIDRRGGQHRKRIARAASEASGSDGGSGTAIFLGTLLDGIPESLVLGIGLALGSSVSLAFLAAVFVSNIPEGIAGTSSLISEGRSRRQVYRMWIALVIASAAAAALGYAFAHSTPYVDGRIAQSFAAGAMLTMLADTMMPEAFKYGGKAAGLLTTLGFLMAMILSILE
jgi:ZIP family zinc transporter